MPQGTLRSFKWHHAFAEVLKANGVNYNSDDICHFAESVSQGIHTLIANIDDSIVIWKCNDSGETIDFVAYKDFITVSETSDINIKGDTFTVRTNNSTFTGKVSLTNLLSNSFGHIPINTEFVNTLPAHFATALIRWWEADLCEITSPFRLPQSLAKLTKDEFEEVFVHVFEDDEYWNDSWVAEFIKVAGNNLPNIVCEDNMNWLVWNSDAVDGDVIKSIEHLYPKDMWDDLQENVPGKFEWRKKMSAIIPDYAKKNHSTKGLYCQSG
jgi:hypothetical protein